MTHVLVVDADTQMRKTVVAAFESAGFSSVSASSAERAIASCETRKPDVIVLDLQLRGHSGVELLHELRSYGEWQQIPVVLYTGVPAVDLTGFEKEFSLIGIKAYLYKPETTLKKLVDTIDDIAVITR